MSVNINNAKLKRCNVNGVKCKRINVNGVKAWSADVTITNSVGSDSRNNHVDYELPGSSANRGTKVLLSLGDLVAGHRYYIRAFLKTWGGGGSVHAVQIVDNGMTKAIDLITSDATEHTIHTLKGTTLTVQHTWDGSAEFGASVGTSADLYMVVDITEFEEAKGALYTADGFINEVGLFYDTKTVEI